MHTRIGVLSAVVVLGLLLFSPPSLADRIDPIGAEGFMTADAVILGHDSGCMLRSCSGSCDQYASGWKCWTTACYQRYDGEWNGLPILVTSVADCTVYHLWESQGDASSSRVGSGRVAVRAQCWIHVVFSGYGTNDGFCSCQEL